MQSFDSILRKDVAALIPCYHQSYGNATEIVYLEEKPVIVPRTVKTVIKNLARLHAVDLKALRKKYGEMLGCKRAIPIPFSSKMILMPVRMREVISKNDSSRGYINYLMIKDVREEDEGPTSTVVLKNNREIVCYHSIKNLNQHIRNCYYIHQKLVKESGEFHHFSLEYLDCPATKGDIALILKELREIKDKL